MPIEEQIQSLLRHVDLCHKRLAEFVLGLSGDFLFGDEAVVVHQVLLGSQLGTGVTLYHSIRIPASDGEREASELNFTAALTISGSTCSVEARVRAFLESEVSDITSGEYDLFRTQDDGLGLDASLNVLERRVGEMCQLVDAPERVGFARK